MKLTYHRNRDYLLPDLGLTEAEQRPVGKYGRMRLRYLEEHRPGLYTRLLLSGTLMEHLQEIDSTCQERLEQLTRQMQAQEGITEEMKAVNQMEWVQRASILRRAGCKEDAGSNELQQRMAMIEGMLQKLDEQERRFSALSDQTIQKFADLQRQATQVDVDELNTARQSSCSEYQDAAK